MPLATVGKLRRVGWQLPLSFAGLLLVVVVLLSGAAYREMRVVAMGAAEARVHDASRQLAELLGQSGSQRIDETRRLAADPLLMEALRGNDVEGEAPEYLDTFRRGSAAVTVVELWDATGRRLAMASRGSLEAATTGGVFPGWAEEQARVSGFRSDGGIIWYQIAAPIPSSDGVAGYVVQSRELATSPAGTQLISSLIGTNATFVVGEPGGEWTDLSHPVPEPPWTGTSEMEEYRGVDGAWRVGAGRTIPGMPWVVWVSFPREEVLAGAAAFSLRLTGMGLLLVLVSGFGGLGLSRRIASPLGRLREAAGAIAEGDLSRRVEIDGPEELQELGTAFNVMAGRVEESQLRLEELVEERTAELHASVEQFRALATSTHDAIITADASGRILYFNPGAERAFGYSSEEVVGEEVRILIPERLRGAHSAALARYVDTREARVVGRTVELMGRRRDGEEFPVELSLASWEQNGVPHFAGILRDVTARRKGEEMQRRYAMELEAANAELEAFSYSVSHDLRAPLRAIHGFSRALLEDHSDHLDEVGADYLGRVCAAVDRMAALIDDLLELARVARKEMRSEPVELGALAHRIAGELRQDDPDREVELKIEENLIARGDPALLRQVLENLLGNAWKFTSRNPRATIEIGRTNTPERAYFVRDDGAGFDMRYADKLFGVFQRLHPVSEFTGTGVGLAIVQRIIHRHGGRVWAEAAPEQGATFYFTLSDTE